MGPYYATTIPFLVVWYIGFCEWSAKTKIPKFPLEGVSLAHTPPLPEMPPLDSVFFCHIRTSLCIFDLHALRRFAMPRCCSRFHSVKAFI